MHLLRAFRVTLAQDYKLKLDQLISIIDHRYLCQHLHKDSGNSSIKIVF